MNERYNAFADQQYMADYIFYFEAKQDWIESQQSAMEKQAEINFDENINPEAEEARLILEQGAKSSGRKTKGFN